MTSRKISLNSVVGLMLALFFLPLISLAFLLVSPLTQEKMLLREATMFLGSIGLLLYAFRYEACSWRQLGLGRHTLVETTMVVLVGMVLMTLAFWLNHLLTGTVEVLGIRGVDGQSRPLWMLAIISLRAGVLEELFYRAYAINRLDFLTGRRWVAVTLPLLVFSLVHSSQGLRGISIAFMAGAILTVLFLWKRNLWACMIVHFLVDYAPDALLEWYSA